MTKGENRRTDPRAWPPLDEKIFRPGQRRRPRPATSRVSRPTDGGPEQPLIPPRRSPASEGRAHGTSTPVDHDRSVPSSTDGEVVPDETPTMFIARHAGDHTHHLHLPHHHDGDHHHEPHHRSTTDPEGRGRHDPARQTQRIATERHPAGSPVEVEDGTSDWTMAPTTSSSPTGTSRSSRHAHRHGPPMVRRLLSTPVARYLRNLTPVAPGRDLATTEEDIESREARMVVDMVMRVAVIAISAGASASDAIAMALRITATFHLNIHIDITNTSVIVTQHRSIDSDPITALRVVGSRSADYQRLGSLQLLVDDLCERRIDLPTARERLDELVRQPRLYRPWFVTASMGLMGGAIAALFGGNVGDILVAGTATCLVDIVVQALARRHVTAFFTQAVGGAIPTVVALLVMVLRWQTHMDLPISPSLTVAAGMVSLLAGTSVVAAAQDALDGYVVTSSGRFLEVFVQTGGILMGVMTVLWLGLKLGVPAYISPTLGFSSSVVLQVVACSLASVAFGVSSHAGPRTLAICAALGGLSWIGYLIGMWLTSNMPVASGIGAFAVGLVAGVGAPRWKVPQVGLVNAGVVALMPGMMLYRGLYMVMGQQFHVSMPSGGGEMLFQALLVGVALAVGSSLGALTARPFIIPVDRGLRLATLAAWHRGTAVPRETRKHRQARERAEAHPETVDPEATGSWGR